MNTDNDYDNDGNNIVPCPICLSEHCPSKEGGKCPDEDEFVEAMNQSQPEMSEEEQFLYDNNPKYTPKQVRVMLAEARTAEQERVVGIADECAKSCSYHKGFDASCERCVARAEMFSDITEAIRNKELTD